MYALIKHEWRLTGTPLLAVAGGYLGLLLSLSMLTWLRVPVLEDLGFGLSVFLVILFVGGVGIYLIVHYYQTMVGRTAYWTHSLPVRGRLLFLTKTLYALVVLGIATLLSLGSGWYLAFVKLSLAGNPIYSPIKIISLMYTGMGPVMFWFVIVSTVVGSIFNLVAIFAAISIGSQAKYQRMGMGGPLIFGVILYVAIQVVSLVSMLLLPIGIRFEAGVHGPSQGTLVFESMLPSVLQQFRFGAANPVVTVGLGSGIGLAVMLVVVIWWTINAIEKHTSLR